MTQVEMFSTSESLGFRGSIAVTGSVEVWKDEKFSNPQDHIIRIYAPSQLDEEGKLINQTQEIAVFGKESIQKLRDLCDRVLNAGESKGGEYMVEWSSICGG